MNKYLYAILRLKTTSWIKYWLYNKSMKTKGVLSNILEGISFYLTDSLNRKFNLFQIIGRSMQDGTPTPENPVEIKNTGDSGSINEKVQNKNFFDGSTYNASGSYYYSDNLITDNEVMVMSFKDKDTSIDISGCSIGFVDNYNGSTNPSQYRWVINNGTMQSNKSNLSSQDSRTYCRQWFVYPKNGLEKLLARYDIQIEKGTTATEYQAHEEQNISLTLPQGMKLCKIRDVADYFHKEDGKWYKHEAIGEKVIGDDVSVIGLNLTGYAFPKFEIDKSYLGLPINWKSNIAISDKWHNTLTSDLTSGGFSTGSSLRQIMFWHKDVTTVAEAKELLVGSKFQFVKAEPTEIEITDETLIAQLEAMQNIRTYKPVTHISSEDELPANLKIQYWKEG